MRLHHLWKLHVERGQYKMHHRKCFKLPLPTAGRKRMRVSESASQSGCLPLVLLCRRSQGAEVLWFVVHSGSGRQHVWICLYTVNVIKHTTANTSYAAARTYGYV